MAQTASLAAFNVASADDISGHSHRAVQEEFDILPGNDTPLVSWIGYGESIPVDESMIYKTIVANEMPATVTLTTAVVTADTTIEMSTTDAAMLQKNQVILVDSELMLVTTVASTTDVTITKGFAGTTSTTHADNSIAYVLSPHFLDTDVFVEGAKIRGEFKSWYPTQIMYSWSETAMRTAVTSYLTKGQDELAFERARKMIEAQKRLEMDMLYSRAQQPTGTAIGMFGGIDQTIASNTVAAGGVLTASHLNDLAEEIQAWDNSNTDYTVVMNRTEKRIWDAVLNAFFDRRGEPMTNSVGVKVDRFETSLGTFNTLCVPNKKSGTLYFLKKNDIKLRPLGVQGGFSPGWNELTREPAHTNALTREMKYYWLGSLVAGDERKHGSITGITTTGSSYAGYV